MHFRPLPFGPLGSVRRSPRPHIADFEGLLCDEGKGMGKGNGRREGRKGWERTNPLLALPPLPLPNLPEKKSGYSFGWRSSESDEYERRSGACHTLSHFLLTALLNIIAVIRVSIWVCAFKTLSIGLNVQFSSVHERSVERRSVCVQSNTFVLTTKQTQSKQRKYMQTLKSKPTGHIRYFTR